jgi:hypothetical protein
MLFDHEAMNALAAASPQLAPKILLAAKGGSTALEAAEPARPYPKGKALPDRSCATQA